MCYNIYCITQTLYNIMYMLYYTDIIAIINTIYINHTQFYLLMLLGKALQGSSIH